MGIQVFWFLGPNSNSIVQVMSNNKIVVGKNMFERQKKVSCDIYFEVKNKSIRLQ